MKARRALLAYCMAAGFSLAACGGATCPTAPEIQRALASPTDDEPSSGPRSIRAEARVEQWGDGERIRGTVMMFAEREDKLRFDVMTQFGPASTLTSAGGEFALWDQKENRFFQGPSCAANIERLTGLPLRAHEVVALLYGDPRGLRKNAGDDLRFVEQTCDDGQVSLVFERAAGGQHYRRVERYERPEDKAPLQVVAIAESIVANSEVSKSGPAVWSVTFDDYELHGGHWLPSEIRYKMPSRKIDTTLRFKEVAVDVEVPASAFRQQTPPGLTPEPMRCSSVEAPATDTGSVDMLEADLPANEPAPAADVADE